MNYTPTDIREAVDHLIATQSGPEPHFDAVTRDLLLNNYIELQQQLAADTSTENPNAKGAPRRSGLLEVASLGRNIPWLYRLTFHTRGMAQTPDGERIPWDHHVVALRFLPDYLSRAERFEMLRIVEPVQPCPFHPNISTSGAVCVEVYPGESLLEICRSLHELLRWRLRQYDERDALNPEACAWGRLHVDAPLDDRPLFGRPLQIQWDAVAPPADA